MTATVCERPVPRRRTDSAAPVRSYVMTLPTSSSPTSASDLLDDQAPAPVDLEHETSEERHARFELEALPYIDQLYACLLYTSPSPRD